jgi:hypothetical protein
MLCIGSLAHRTQDFAFDAAQFRVVPVAACIGAVLQGVVDRGQRAVKPSALHQHERKPAQQCGQRREKSGLP